MNKIKTHPKLSLIQILGTATELNALNQVLEKLDPTAKNILAGPEAYSLFAMLPPGREPCHKYLYGVYAEDRLVGCLDVIRGYPEPSFAYVGLFVLEQEQRDQGFGAKLWNLAETIIGSWNEIKKWRLGVALQNKAAERFWHRMEFLPTGEKSISHSRGFEIECALFEKPILAQTMGHFEATENFATAMDHEDFATAVNFISPDCRYDFRHEEVVGREVIMKMYRDNAVWAKENLDQIDYSHGLGFSSDGCLIISYADHITHRMNKHAHNCRQILEFQEDGLISRIRHQDLPGETDSLRDFFKKCGIKR